MTRNSFKKFLFAEKEIIYYNPKLKPQARNLRKNMTAAEKLLWARIRKKQLKDLQFYRQKILGEYIVDFYCPKAKLVIELDGARHNAEDVKGYDLRRTDYLNSVGIRILRIWNKDVSENLDGVVNAILEKL